MGRVAVTGTSDPCAGREKTHRQSVTDKRDEKVYCVEEDTHASLLFCLLIQIKSKGGDKRRQKVDSGSAAKEDTKGRE